MPDLRIVPATEADLPVILVKYRLTGEALRSLAISAE
jgi:hypothetical protein